MAETTMILTDNSEDGINGDYPPSRWESQIDAVSILLASKYQAMTDSAAGLATMAGKAVEVLCTPTQDGSKVSSTLFGAKIGGHLHLINALNISILALKNRPNNRTRQRILLFIGSRVEETADELKVVARKLAKNNIALTIFAFGDLSVQQRAKLDTLWKTVNTDENSQLYWLERGRNLTDNLVSSALFRDDKGGSISAPEVDQDMDPELAMAIKMSLEENQKRENEEREKAAAASAADKPKEEKGVAPAGSKMEVEKVDNPDVNDLDDDQAEELAKQLSLQEAERERQQNLRSKDAMEDEKDEKEDDKKKKEQDKETLASERFEQSEVQKGDVGHNDFLTEKHNPIPKDSRTEKFSKALDELADDDDDEEEDKKEGKDKKKGKHHTEKHHTEKHQPKKEDEP